jgi:hypothetical protein
MTTKEKIDSLVLEFLDTDISKKLPTTGFLAGGALSNWIIHRTLGTQAPIINDLDIFTIDNVSTENTWITSLTGWNPEIVQSGYNYIMKLSFENWYKILTCKREGLVNSISVEVSPGSGYKSILENFDLDLCAVGCDLSTREVLYTPAFEKFFDELPQKREFSLQNLNSPDKTLIRALKKSIQLGLSFSKNDFDFLYYTITELPGLHRKTFSDKLAEDFLYLQKNPKTSQLLQSLKLVRREDIEDYLFYKSNSYHGEKHFKLWSLEQVREFVVPKPNDVEEMKSYRYFRTYIHVLNLYRAVGGHFDVFKGEDFLQHLEYLAFTGWVDMDYNLIVEQKEWIEWISKITSASPRSFNYFRKKGLTKSIEQVKKMKSSSVWNIIGKIFDNCSFSLIDEYLENPDDELSEAYLEISSRKSIITLVQDW